MAITIKTGEAIEKMRTAGRLAADVLVYIEPYIEAGVSTDYLNDLCHRYITEVQQAIPAPLNYNGFPKSICTSVNNQICHGIPNPKLLKNGDIINIDVTIIKDSFHGDTSKMFFVGKPSILARRLTQVSYECLQKSIELVRPGLHIGDIGHTIQQHAEKNGYSVVREYCGHGIGLIFHEDPLVLHYGKPGTGILRGWTFSRHPAL